MSVTVLAGGVGAAKLLRGMSPCDVGVPVTAVVNTGDDTDLLGLSISPDLDTITYTLADAIDPTRGWGLRDESWRALEALGRYGEVSPAGSRAATTWFNLGDRDLATHLYRTARRHEGATLTEVTAEIVRAWDLDVTLLPMTDDRFRTMITLASGEDVAFQDYFVKLRHDVAVSAVHFDHDGAEPTAETLDALGAEVVVIAPSNPLVSIGPILELPGVRRMLSERRDSVVAVSPIVGGSALKGPADRMLRELGQEPSVVGIARAYRDIAGTVIIDPADEHLADEVRSTGVRCEVVPTVMASAERSAELARTCLRVARRPS